MLILDGTIVNIALASIRDSLGFSETGPSWAVNAYALAFGGLLLLGGPLGDTFGRRRVLVAGVLLFTTASAIGGIAPSAAWLVPLTVVIMGTVEPNDAGAASSLMQTASQVGGAIGLATLVTVFGRTSRSALEVGLDPIAAFTEGVQTGITTAVVIGVAILLVALFGIQSRRL